MSDTMDLKRRSTGARAHTGHSLQIWRLDESLDDSSVRGHDGENHTGQKHQSQLVDVPAQRTGVSSNRCPAETCVLTLPHAYKHDQGHQEEAARAIHTHVVEHRGAFIEQCCCWNNVNLDTPRTERTVLVIP